ncbi:MAG: DUF2764 family protein [Kiritimatiellia bacterium]
MNYYFFAASLPMLSLDSAPPLSYKTFKTQCSEHLSPRDAAALSQLEPVIPESSRHSFVSAWRENEIEIRNAVAKTRSERGAGNAADFLRKQRGYEPSIHRAVAEAFTADNPKDREKALDKIRWSLLDDMESRDQFSSCAVLGYSLKLRMSERWNALSREDGRRSAGDIAEKPPSEENNAHEDAGLERRTNE